MSQSTWFAIALGVGLLTGALLAAQPSANGYLGRQVAEPLQASLISFASGTTIILLVLLALGQFPPSFKNPPSTLPWWAWTGGAIGTVMVTTSLIFVPKIGSLAWFAVVMTGQVVAALMLDHFGWMGNAKQPASPLRLFGALLLIGGIACISFSRSRSVVKHADERPVAEGAAQGDDGAPHAIDQLGEHLAEES